MFGRVGCRSVMALVHVSVMLFSIINPQKGVPRLQLSDLSLSDVGAVDAGLAVSTGADAGGLARALGTLELLADGLDTGGLGVGDGGGIAEVLVDTSKDVTRGSNNTIDGDVTLVHGVAVAARAVQLAEVLDSEVGDGDSAGTVVLDDLFLHVC